MRRQDSSKQLGRERWMSDDNPCTERQDDTCHAEVSHLADAIAVPQEQRPEKVELVLHREGPEVIHGEDAAGLGSGGEECVLQKEPEDPYILHVPASDQKGHDHGDAKICEIQRQYPESATGEEVAITMLGSASIDNYGSEEDAGEDEKERRTDSVPFLQPDEVQDDGGLGAASQMVQHDERHGEKAHPIKC